MVPAKSLDEIPDLTLESGVVANGDDVFGIVGTTQSGNFHVERVVAEGGFGVVYRAHHTGFRAPVALKCLKIPGQMSAAQRAVFLEKFRAEAELLFRLSTKLPQVVRPLHIGELSLTDGSFAPFLALEWLEGETFSDLIARRAMDGRAPVSLRKLVKLLSPVAQALHSAHRFDGELAIIHRDLKPENLFLAESHGNRTVRILDYGIAKARAAASTEVGRATNDDFIVFTPAYAAPEQWKPQQYGQAGAWTDVWGLAITMVEALIGRPPLQGEFHEMLAMASDPVRRPTPGTLGASISAEADLAFTQALAVDPRSRTATIADFWTALESALGLPRTFADIAGANTHHLASHAATLAHTGPQIVSAQVAPDHPLTKFGELELVVPSPPPAFGPTRAVGTPKRVTPALDPTIPLALQPKAAPAASREPNSHSGVQARQTRRDPPSAPVSARASMPSIGHEPFDDWEDEPPAGGVGVITVDRDPQPVRAGGQGGMRQANLGQAKFRQVEVGQANARAGNARANSARPNNARPNSARPNSARYANHGDNTREDNVRRRLATPARLMVIAFVVGLVDFALARYFSFDVALGPVQLTWIAAALGIAAVMAMVWQFFSE